jgi:RNA-directed DNA polymerase
LLDASWLERNLRFDPAVIVRLAALPQHVLFRRFEVPKKGRRRRQVRVVYAPHPELRPLLRAVANWINARAEFPPCVQGFVPGRSNVTNATMHLGRAFILHADIESFFNHILPITVTDAFRMLGCPRDCADLLTRVTTVDGHLPQGSSASPILSNIVCRHLDADFLALAAEYSCVYSRYADDITMSGDTVPPSHSMAAVLNRHGFNLRDRRCLIQRRGRTQYVTGLSVADPAMPRLPRWEKHRIRLEMYYASRFGLESHSRHTHPGENVTRVRRRLESSLSRWRHIEHGEWFRAKWRVIPTATSPEQQSWSPVRESDPE